MALDSRRDALGKGPRRPPPRMVCSCCYLQELQNVQDGVVRFMGICDHNYCIVNKNKNLY